MAHPDDDLSVERCDLWLNQTGFVSSTCKSRAVDWPVGLEGDWSCCWLGRRAIEHLAHVFPDMSLEKRIAIATASFNNTGHTLIESYSTSHMLERMKESALLSNGHDAFETVQPQRRFVILVTGHFGNDEAPRAALVARRFKIDGFYRNKSNP